MVAEDAEVLIVGAGLQGCCIALELARRGVETLLIDQDQSPCRRAALRNEGKVHLGLVYAADASLSTAQLQLRGALTFHRAIERWIDLAAQPLSLSTPFVYVAAKDSLPASDALEAHYRSVDALYRRTLVEDPSLNYLGLLPSVCSNASRTLTRPDGSPLELIQPCSPPRNAPSTPRVSARCSVKPFTPNSESASLGTQRSPASIANHNVFECEGFKRASPGKLPVGSSSTPPGKTASLSIAPSDCRLPKACCCASSTVYSSMFLKVFEMHPRQPWSWVATAT